MVANNDSYIQHCSPQLMGRFTSLADAGRLLFLPPMPCRKLLSIPVKTTLSQQGEQTLLSKLHSVFPFIVLLVVISLLAVQPFPAMALPAPMSQQQLEQGSDLILRLRVVDVIQRPQIDHLAQPSAATASSDKQNPSIDPDSATPAAASTVIAADKHRPVTEHSDTTVSNISSSNAPTAASMVTPSSSLNYALAVIQVVEKSATFSSASLATTAAAAKLTTPALASSSAAPAAASGDVILLCWKNLRHDLVGAWSVSFSRGEESRNYLRWDAAKRCYTATYWHGKEVFLPGADPAE